MVPKCILKTLSVLNKIKPFKLVNSNFISLRNSFLSKHQLIDESTQRSVQKRTVIINIPKMVCQHQYNLAAKESGLEHTCVNNDDFTVLISRGSICH